MAQHMEACLVVHVPFVGVSLFIEQEGPAHRRQHRGHEIPGNPKRSEVTWKGNQEMTEGGNQREG